MEELKPIKIIEIREGIPAGLELKPLLVYTCHNYPSGSTITYGITICNSSVTHKKDVPFTLTSGNNITKG